MKAFLYLGCAAGALIAAPAMAQTAATSSQTQGATPDTAATSPDAPAAADDAQDEQEPGLTAGGKRKARVEERDVVVTGSRFQKLLEQPQHATIISAEERNLAGVNDVRELIAVQPGFNYTADFGINVRGVGRQTAQTLLGQENTVIEYVDGFINLVPGNIAESTLFGGNVTFVRGPAGTTFGRNAIGGAINVISRAPTREYTAQLTVGTARSDAYNFGVNFSGPITSNLGFRVGIQEYKYGSYYKAIGNSAKGAGTGSNQYVEFQLEWRPGPFHFRNRATTYIYDTVPTYPSLSRYSNNLGGNVTPVFGSLSPNPAFGFTGPAPAAPYQTNVNDPGYDRLRHNFQDIFNGDVNLGFANLIYVGGYQRYIASGDSDRDLTSRTSYDGNTVAPGTFAAGTQVPTDYRANYYNDNYFWTQEARLEGKAGHPVRWVAGFYYFNQDFDEQYWENIRNATDAILNPIIGTTVPAGSTLPPLVLTPNPRRSTYEQRNLYQIRSTATFGNVVWDLNDHLRFDGGLRYTWDEKNAVTNFRFIYYYPPVYAADFSPLIHSANTFRRDQGLSGRASVGWHDSGGNQVYAAYSRGYQSSAFTLGQGLPGTTGRDNIADKEFLDVYEVGANYGIGKVRFDGAVFYQLFHDQQIPVSTRGVVNTPMGPVPGPLYSAFVSAKKTEIYGLESRLTYRPNVQSNIVLSYTYLHAEFKDFANVIDLSQPCNAQPLVAGTQCTTPPTPTVPQPGYFAPTNPLYQTPQNLAGNELSRTPHHKASAYGYYGIELGSFGHLYPGGTVYYQSPFYTSIFNRPNFRVPGRTIANVTLTYRTADDRLDLTGVVSNVFDKRYADSSALATFGSGTVQQTVGYGAARYWSLTARYRF